MPHSVDSYIRNVRNNNTYRTVSQLKKKKMERNRFITNILTASSWTIFLIFLLPYLFSYLIPKGLENIFVPLIGILALNIWFLWICIIGNELNKRLPDFLIKPNRLFNLSITYLIIGFTLLMVNSYWLKMYTNSFILLALTLLGFASLYYSLYFTSRSLKELEKKRNVTYSEYITIGFSLFVFLIGVWIIQPRIRNLILNPDYKEGVK